MRAITLKSEIVDTITSNILLYMEKDKMAEPISIDIPKFFLFAIRKTIIEKLIKNRINAGIFI